MRLTIQTLSAILFFNIAFIIPSKGQQKQPLDTNAAIVIVEKKTPVLSLGGSTTQLIDFSMDYANAKIELLKNTDTLAARRWRDYFINRADAYSAPAGVIAFSNKLVGLFKAAKTDSSIVLANITGEYVMDVVFRDYQRHVQQLLTHQNVSKQQP